MYPCTMKSPLNFGDNPQSPYPDTDPDKILDVGGSMRSLADHVYNDALMTRLGVSCHMYQIKTLFLLSRDLVPSWSCFLKCGSLMLFVANMINK